LPNEWLALILRHWTLLRWTRDHICNQRRNRTISRNRVTPNILKRLADSIPAHLKTPDGQSEALALAAGILRIFLGADWVEKHVVSDGSKKGFLSVKEDDPVQREILPYYRPG
jgi:hypothetical protein